jgi:hypothetical protein
MGRVACVTTFSQAGYVVYGQRMLQTFKEFWPEDIDLFVYHEGKKPVEATSRAIWYPLDEDRDRRRFLATHEDHPHDYRRQPIKFCHKVFAVSSVPRQGIDWLVWLDGDLVTKSPVTHEFLTSIMPEDVCATYLGRRWWAHTEAGFLAYNLNQGGALLLDDMRRFYTTDKLKTLYQQHDCSVFDYCRQSMEHHGARFLDLGEDFKGPGLDVMANSVLAPYLHHNKGPKRKLQAYGAVA